MSKGRFHQRDTLIRDRIARWRDAFVDEETGILPSLENLIWDYAVYCIVIRTIYLANQKRESRPPINGMLFELISKGYWSTLLLGIRRLVDESGAIKGGRGIYSLNSVINDIEACQKKITRKVYVEWIYGARYSVDEKREQQDRRLREAAAKKQTAWGDRDIAESDMAHARFDSLSSISKGRRTPEDLIDPAIFTLIRERLIGLGSIARHVSTHLAHAGNIESRENSRMINFDIRNAREALRQLKEVADLMGCCSQRRVGQGYPFIKETSLRA